MSKLRELLPQYARDTENAEINFSLALEYEAIGQTAAALSYFLRAAERTADALLAYECLLKIGLCFERQGRRGNSVRGAYKHAVCLLPKRPEAYFLLARHYERTGDHVSGYMYSELGLNFCGSGYDVALRTNVEFPGKYALIFQKAVSAWWWGKPEESRKLFLDLWDNYPLDDLHRSAVEKNLKTLNIPYSPRKVVIKIPGSEPKKDSMDIVLQGKYDYDTDEIITEYLKLPWVNNIIVSCWEDDATHNTIHNNRRVKFVRSKYPSSPGTDNRNLQIVSSLAGMKQVTTEFAAKMRSDQLYDAASMNRMYEWMKKKHKANQIFVAGMYIRLLFHPRDHIFWGKTSDLINLFSCPLEQHGLVDRIRVKKDDLFGYITEFTRAETYLGAHYLAQFRPEINRFLLHPEKYLYDGAPEWVEVKKVSDRWTGEYFLPFPRSGIDLKWKRKGWDTYPYDAQASTGESWGAEIPDDLDMGDNCETFKSFVYNEIVKDRMYERFHKVKDGDVVVDIGSNVGVFPYSLKDRDPKLIVCVEPSESLYRTLRENLAKMPFANKTFAYNYAITDSDGTKEVSDTDWIYGKPQSVFKTKTFKNFLAECGVDHIDFMKIDCEGGEYDIFNEENYEFLTTKVKYITGEWHLGGLDNGVGKFIQFKNLYLKGRKNFRVFEPYIWKDVTSEILNDDYIIGFYQWYNPGEAAQLQVYIDNGT